MAKPKQVFLSSPKAKPVSAQEDINALVPIDRVEPTESFELTNVDISKSVAQAERIAKYMSSKCRGEKYVAMIQGKPYPTVNWWTTMGAVFGLFPCEVASRKLARPQTVYESLVEIRNGGRVIGRASAICSSSESRWMGREEHAIKSMATTRATAKAFRLGFSFLAVLAGLEPTPAEEMIVEPLRPTRRSKK